MGSGMLRTGLCPLYEVRRSLIGDNRTICYRGSVRAKEGTVIEVLLYMYISDRSQINYASAC